MICAEKRRFVAFPEGSIDRKPEAAKQQIPERKSLHWCRHMWTFRCQPDVARPANSNSMNSHAESLTISYPILISHMQAMQAMHLITVVVCVLASHFLVSDHYCPKSHTPDLGFRIMKLFSGCSCCSQWFAFALFELRTALSAGRFDL